MTSCQIVRPEFIDGCRIKRVSLIDNDTTQLIRKDGNLAARLVCLEIQK